MKYSNIFLTGLILSTIFVACGQTGEKETTSGHTYTVYTEGEGEVAPDSSFLVMNMIYKDGDDSTWVDTNDMGMPIVLMKQAQLWKTGAGVLEEVFATLKPGDSIYCEVSAVDLFTKTWKRPIPATVDSSSTFKFYVGLDKVLDQQGYQEWRMEMMQKQQQKQAAAAEEQLLTDIETIGEYLNEKGIEAQKTESGLHYVIQEEGQGSTPVPGDTVRVNYAGYVLNGEYFDTSIKSIAEEQGIYDPRREPYEPIEFPLGRGAVIKGWDEGIALLKPGGKATLYIPSGLAYGARQASEVIKANSILVFDVELVSVN